MKEIEDILGKANVKYNESMSKHTSFKVGGPAEIFANVDSEKKLIKLLEFCKENNIKVTIIGNGSNLIVSDNGIQGIVIKYSSNNIKIDENSGDITVEAGVTNPYLANKLMECELSGFEFASGIPGTIAGAIYMNAGAYDNEIGEIITYVKYVDMDTLEVKELHKKDLEFSYRKSIFQSLNGIIIEAKMHLEKSTKEKIKEKMDEYKKKRNASQPLDMPSAGSVFKRGADFIPAKLIDEAGLKGHKIGGAMVSEKHAGFIVNTGDAKTDDILQLIDYIKKVIYEKYGKKLETEVRIIK